MWRHVLNVPLMTISQDIPGPSKFPPRVREDSLMSIAYAIVLTLVATTLARIGIVLLKQAIANLSTHQVQGRFQLAICLAQSRRGLLGIALEIAGYGLFLWALSDPSAPISIL